MKKILLFLPLLALAVSCSQQKQWDQQQRRQVREELRSYRDMVYLQDLSDAEYTSFTDKVADSIERSYPVYATFVEIPGKNDTVTYFVVGTIVNDLETDAHNMRHLFPYRQLVDNGILPKGLERDQQRSFYACLADKVDDYYGSMDAFFNAVLNKNADTGLMRAFMGECANDEFDWQITEIDVYEQQQ